MLTIAARPTLAAEGEYRLEFLPTFNIGEDSGAGGTMTIRVLSSRQSVINFKVWNLYPNTVYTIWTVFNDLSWRPGFTSTTSNSVPACGATGGGCNPMVTDPVTGVATPGPSIPWKGWDGYPKEGGKVSPTGALKSAYTHGIRLDPGSTFVTDRHGNGQVTIKLDFDALDENPVSLKQLLTQCRPGTADASGKCSGDNVVDITTTWMRRFIVEFPADKAGLTPRQLSAARAEACANYDPAFDPDSDEYDESITHHTDSRFWQCVDPESDLVRVQRFPVAHFRIANHPDALTHGHIGGDHNDHWIDLVGPRECIVPVGHAAPIKTLEPAPVAVGTPPVLTSPPPGWQPFPLSQCKPLTNTHRARHGHDR
jgi:hypothetical protein